LAVAAAVGIRLVLVWCRNCRHRIEPDAAAQAQRRGAEIAILDRPERLVCSNCGRRDMDGMVSGTKTAGLPRI
jgi:hypothetical protein